jgi:hypothetical protein
MRMLREICLPREQHGIPELVGAISVPLEFRDHTPQHRISGEGAQQLAVAVTGLVHAGDDHVDDAQARSPTDALGGETRTGA